MGLIEAAARQFLPTLQKKVFYLSQRCSRKTAGAGTPTIRLNTGQSKDMSTKSTEGTGNENAPIYH